MPDPVKKAQCVEWFIKIKSDTPFGDTLYNSDGHLYIYTYIYYKELDLGYPTKLKFG